MDGAELPAFTPARIWASPGQRPDPPLLPAQRLPRTPALPTGDRPWRRQPWRRLHPPPTAHGRPPARDGGTAQPLHTARRRRARYCFVAGGIGITPILSMVRWLPGAGQDWRLPYAGPRTPARSLPRRTDDAPVANGRGCIAATKATTRQYRADRRPRCRRRTLLLRDPTG